MKYSFHKKAAADFGVKPAYVEGQKQHGLLFFISRGSRVIGAQCENCNIVVWGNPEYLPFLNEKRPPAIPSSGSKYREYIEIKISNFLSSITCCPNCNHGSFDKFITNYTFPRFPDGCSFDETDVNIQLIYEDPEQVMVWWMEYP